MTRIRGSSADFVTEPIGGMEVESYQVIVDVVDGGAGSGSFTVEGDKLHLFPIGRTIDIYDSTGNNGTYTVAAPGASFDPAPDYDTIIPVVEPVPSAVADGKVRGYGVDLQGTKITNASTPSGSNPNDGATVEYVTTITNAILSIPAGAVLPYAGVSAPSRFVFCDGSTYDADADSSFMPLFAAIGTVYGGTGSNNFKVPDMRGRIPGALDNLGGASANRITDSQADSLGGSYGAQTHTLSTAEMPVHGHSGSTGSAGFHGHTGSTSSASANITIPRNRLWDFDPDGFDIDISGGNGVDWGDAGTDFTDSGSHSHTLSIVGNGAHTHTVSVTNAGSGDAHNNVQPTLFLSYIISKG